MGTRFISRPLTFMWKEFLIKRGISESIIRDSRISYIYPWIRIPYLNENLETIKGRWFGSGKEQRPVTIPKYIWLRGKPEFPFNWNPLGWDTFLYICEGELDTILLRESFKINGSNSDNVIGLPLGALTFKESWINLLKKNKDLKIFSLLDNDAAGLKGAQNIANKLGVEIQHVIWPSNQIGFDLSDFAKGNILDLVKRIGGLTYKTLVPSKPDLIVYGRKKITLASSIEDLKKNIPIEDIVGRIVELRKTSFGFETHCPFHVDKIPSFKIYKETNSFYCFSCGVGGSSLDFLMKYNGGISLSKAIDFLQNNYVKNKRE
jgi:hypothetical protein